MLRSILILATGLFAGAVGARELPDGWFMTGSNPDAYTAAPDAGADGRSAVLRSIADPEGRYGALAQAVRADAYKGRRVRLTARVKTQDASGWAGLWLRGDDARGTIVAFDNMKDRPIKGTTDWQPCTVILDLPPTTATLVYGVLLNGTGAAWLDDVKIDVVGPDVEVTWAVTIEMPKRPVEASVVRAAPENLSLETWSAAPMDDAPSASSGPVTRPVRIDHATPRPKEMP